MAIFGLGRQKPHHYLEMAQVAWENRDELPFAWRILNDGVCDGCALGTSGLSDWTLPGTHLCMVRLELMRLNTAPALDPAVLADVGAARHAIVARAARAGTAARADDTAPRRARIQRRDLGRSARSDRARAPHRSIPPAPAFYLTSRGITNEVYYAAQKAARFFGSHHVDNSARLCHAASTAAMKATLGYGASTCSYADWLHADLIVLFGSNVANNQPVTTKYLHYAKKNGAEIAVVNPYREPGLERYWIPSIPESALFGTALADHWFDVDTGGDLAFLVGVLRALVELDGVDAGFVRERTIGFDEARARAEAGDWSQIERESGVTRERIEAFARLLIERPNAVFVWSMGLTQHVARRRHDQGAGECRPRARVARPAESRARADPRTLGRAGRRRGRLCAVCGSRDGRTMVRDVGISRFRRAAAGRPPRWSSVPRVAKSICSGSSAAISSKRFPTRRDPDERWRVPGCACITTSCCRPRCWSRVKATWCCFRRRPGTNRRAAARKPRPSGASSSRRKFLVAGSDRRNRSGGCLAK